MFALGQCRCSFPTRAPAAVPVDKGFIVNYLVFLDGPETGGPVSACALNIILLTVNQ